MDEHTQDLQVGDIVEFTVKGERRTAEVMLLTIDDVVLEMPPVPTWFRGRADYRAFMAGVFARRGTGWCMQATRANGQAAFVAYAPNPSGDLEMHSYQVFSVQPGGIGRATVFYDQVLMRHLGVPPGPQPRTDRATRTYQR